MEGKPQKRQSDTDTTANHSCSQEKRPKLSDTATSTSSKEKRNGTVVCSQASVEYRISYLSDDKHPVTYEEKGNKACELDPEENTMATRRIRDSGESLSASSQVTIVLSESEDNDEGYNANQNNVTLNLGVNSQTPSPSPRQLWKEMSLLKDADTIAGIVPDADSALVFDILAKHRANPDRLNIATATILDGSSSAADATDKMQGASSLIHMHDAARHVATDENSGQGTSHGDNSLYSDVKKVVTRVKAMKPDAEVNATEVYLLLEQHAKEADRIGFVCNALLGNSDPSHQQTSSSNDIFNQAMKLNSEFPHINPSEIYELLESLGGQENALQSVREKLQAHPSRTTQRSVSHLTSTPKGPISRDDSISNDPLVRNDPVFRDMRIISRMFPEKDQNEIYALVEAHYYKKDRVQVVIEELLRVQKNSQDNSTLPHSLELEASVFGNYFLFSLLFSVHYMIYAVDLS